MTEAPTTATGAAKRPRTAADLGFLGNHNLVLDEKFRVTVPKRFKSVLQRLNGESDSGTLPVVATIALQRQFRRIMVFPADAWQRYYSQFQRMPVLDLDTQNLTGLLTSLAIPCELDSQGRIRLDQRLLDLARIRKKVLATGQVDHFELWNPDKYEEFVEDTINHVDTMADKAMARLGPALVGGASPAPAEQ